MTTSDYHWLTGPDAARWLRELAETVAPLHTIAARLRCELSAARVHLLLEQVELRRRARAKFRAADRMFFTRTSLEQATDEVVAAYKAARFPGEGPLVDLCCGIGGDLLALGTRSATTGVDRDEAVAILAEANARLWQEQARTAASLAVHRGDAAVWPVREAAAWHIDPDRRPEGRRTTRVALHEPSEAALDQLRAQNSAASFKLAPAAELPAHWVAGAEQEWISRQGQCRQLVAWFGALAQYPGLRRATIVFDDGRPPRSLVGMPDDRIPLAAGIDRFVYEPDAAVLAAGLTGSLAAEHQLAALATDCAYLTGSTALAELALSCFEVQEVLPFQPKRLRALLRSRGIGRLEIKKRGVPHDPQQLRKQLAPQGDHEGTLLLARLPQGVQAILARRVVTPRP